MGEKNIAKILITGPFNAGKTTLIKFISSEQLLSRDVLTSDRLAKFKPMTTVGLDFGILHVNEMLDVHLFGTPGQARFNFMWEVLSRGALGTIFLVDSSSTRAIHEGCLMYRYYCEHQYYHSENHAPIVIGATKRDVEGAVELHRLAAALQVPREAIIPCDPRKKEDSKMLVTTLLERIIDQGEEREPEPEEEDEYDAFF